MECSYMDQGCMSGVMVVVIVVIAVVVIVCPGTSEETRPESCKDCND